MWRLKLGSLRKLGEAKRGAKDGRSEATTVYYYSKITSTLPLVASLLAFILTLYVIRFAHHRKKKEGKKRAKKKKE